MNHLKTRRTAPFVITAIAAIGMLGLPALAAQPPLSDFGPALDGGSAATLARPLRGTLAAGSACAVAFRSTIPAKGVQLWYVKNAPHALTIGWYVMADTTSPGPSVSLVTTATQQTDASHTTYWLGMTNYATTTQAFEMRLCVL